MWKIKKLSKPRLKEPILIEGLPGIGNVGKIAVDYLIGELKAKPYLEFQSHYFPPTAVVNEKGLISLYTINISYAKVKNNHLLFLHGDIQPSTNEGIFTFCEEVLKICKKIGVKEIITTGGIGLASLPKTPHIYATSYNRELLKKYKSQFKKLKTNMFGHVGPIMGVTGLLPAMAREYDIDSIALLVDTVNEPFYFGIKSSKLLLDIISKKIDIKINFSNITKEIENIEMEIIKKIQEMDTSDTSYIG